MRHLAVICCATLVTAPAALAQGSPKGDFSVTLRSGPLTLRSLGREGGGLRAKLRTARPKDELAASPVVVGFERRLSEKDQEALFQKGVRVIDYLEKSAYIVRVPTLEPQVLRDLTKDINPITHIASLGDPRRKVGPELVAYVRRAAPATRAAGAPAPQVRLTVVLWPDADVGAVRKELEGIGKVVNESVEAKSLEVVVSGQAEMQAIAAKPGVRAIEPALPAQVQNDKIRQNIGIDTVWHAPHDLRGRGVTVGVFDGWLVAESHPSFRGRLTAGEVLGAPTTPRDIRGRKHATHVAGTIAGTGEYVTQPSMEGASKEPAEFEAISDLPRRADNGGPVVESIAPVTENLALQPPLQRYAGMAPEAAIMSYRFSNTSSKLYNHLKTEKKIDVANNSWGQPPAKDAIDCSVFGAYNSESRNYDLIIHGRVSEQVDGQMRWVDLKRIPVVFSGGNYRDDPEYSAACGFDIRPPFRNYRTLVPVATAKNVITVGAIDADTRQVTDFSSYGPTLDRRIKPDIVAPGCRAWGPGKRSGILSAAPEDTLSKSCGTSMAAPAVSGAVALMVEKLQKSGFDKATILPSTYKALLIHAAQDLGRNGPDYEYGFGRVRVPETMGLIDRKAFKQGVATSEGAVFEQEIEVGPRARTLRATLAWDDRAAAVERNGGLVNDLDLELIGPGGGSNLPLVPSTAEREEHLPARPAVDKVNVVEQVTIDFPQPGKWKAVVKASSLGLAPQSYSIVLTSE